MSSTQQHHPPAAACPGCDLILAAIPTPEHHAALCPRCRHLLHRDKHNPVVKTMALSLTGLLLYLPAICLPLLTMGILGSQSEASIIGSTLQLIRQQQLLVGTVVLCTAILFPLYLLTSLSLVSLGLLTRRRPPWLATLFRHYNQLGEWAMSDIYLVAVFITVIKMNHSATIDFNLGFYCFSGLVLVIIAARSAVDRTLFWALLDPARPGPEEPESANREQPRKHTVCHSCHQTLWLPQGQPPPLKCPRCRALLHRRKKNSLSRTWALLVTAMLLSLPANLLPIMEVASFGVPERSTIMDGIVYFFQDGSYGIGIIILTASILVPLFKIIGMIIILLSIHCRWQRGLRHKAAMFRFIEFIGRWSMLDIFVIALLCGLVQFGFLSTIKTAPATLYFTGVVLSTMLAAITFDPRLLWDASSNINQR
ncbi:paraquat-inducible protein A [Desulfogranum mediterraneum]|uniref:paraquat-inducible protein A n=1 Tax=Desulfogranum mediterraneum TaxID=160661 RepID=UPI0003FC6077|nr:paraquat-inducible protein A [Desulfogranum mediterraneum]